MLCWPRLAFTTTQATTLSWAQLAESTSESAPCRLPIQEILISLGLCLPVKVAKDSNLYKFSVLYDVKYTFAPKLNSLCCVQDAVGGLGILKILVDIN